MPRLPRVYIEGILYYVTSKAGHNQSIFIHPSDYKEYIALVNKYKSQYGFKLFSFVLLPTHLHLLIELKKNIGISNIMHDVHSLYTKTFNSTHNKKGHVFQERFRAVLAEKETYLLQLTRHIHLNPKRVKLVYEPRDYPYSSYSQFLDPSKRGYPDMKEEIEEVFQTLKGREETLQRYVENTDPAEINDFGKILHKKRILGSKDFSERIKKTIEDTAEIQKKTPLSKKLRLIYILLGGTLLFTAVITVGYFYKQATTMKSKYDKTLALYKRTIETLEREKSLAVTAKKGVEDYAWKIELTERALEDLKQKKAGDAKAAMGLEGYTWRIRLTQIGGPSVDFPASDMVFFEGNRVTSINLSREGFPGATYSKRELRNDNIVWETMQINEGGDRASWRGEWNGKVMKGILSRRSAKGTVRDFSFVSMGERVKR